MNDQILSALLDPNLARTAEIESLARDLRYARARHELAAVAFAGLAAGSIGHEMFHIARADLQATAVVVVQAAVAFGAVADTLEGKRAAALYGVG
jgi:predicted metalloprotease